MTRKHIIIPSETQVREFDAKLLFACRAAMRGYRCIVGSRAAIHSHLHRIPRGLYVAKDVARSSRKIFSILRQLGFKMIGWDEEALLYHSTDQYLHKRACTEVIDSLELFVAWGDKQAEDIANAAQFSATPIIVAGNPRTDLLRPEARSFYQRDVLSLQKQYGRFLLVNTNFGRLNHFVPELSLTPSAPGQAAFRNIEAFDIPLDVWVFREKIYKAFQKMIPLLAAQFPEDTIVVRPHPAENAQTWSILLKNINNVVVIDPSKSPIIPWLLGAEAVIHNGCTSAIEAFLLGRPTIAFRPEKDLDREIMLPNQISASAGSVADLCDAIRRCRGGIAALDIDASKQQILSRHIAATAGALASDRILDAIERVSAGLQVGLLAGIAQRAIGIGRSLARSYSKRLKSVIPGHKNNHNYSRHRFAPLRIADVRQKVAAMESALGQPISIRVSRLAPDVFELSI